MYFNYKLYINLAFMYISDCIQLVFTGFSPFYFFVSMNVQISPSLNLSTVNFILFPIFLRNKYNST